MIERRNSVLPYFNSKILGASIAMTVGCTRESNARDFYNAYKFAFQGDLTRALIYYYLYNIIILLIIYYRYYVTLLQLLLKIVSFITYRIITTFIQQINSFSMVTAIYIIITVGNIIT